MESCSKDNNIITKIRSNLVERKTSANLNRKRVVLVGNPNVGKSVIFNSLTGSYVTVSNYPGTTVEINTGKFTFDDFEVELIDTPGMYSMISITDEERVTMKILTEKKPDLVVHVIDAKNIKRMLPLTIQLIEAGFSVVLILNIMDEAKTLGINIDTNRISKLLNINVIEASAALNKGLNDVLSSIKEQLSYVA